MPKNNSNMVKTDLPVRIEMRYITQAPEEFLKRMGSSIIRKVFSTNEFVENIYLNNDDHVVPFDTSVKLRRYLPKPLSSFVIKNNPYLLEYKQSEGNQKKKFRIQTTLAKAVMIANDVFSFAHPPLRPFIGIQYHRQHYVPRRGNGMRITIDSNIRYYYFPLNRRRAVAIGNEQEYQRIEIKSRSQRNAISQKINRVLDEIGALPIISKRFTAYQFLLAHTRKTWPLCLHREFPRLEFETKIDDASSVPFDSLRKLFSRAGGLFIPARSYPYIGETASINEYYERKNNEIIKVMFKGGIVKTVIKGKGIIKSVGQYHIPVMRRHEFKRIIKTLNNALPPHSWWIGGLERKKKVFWVERISTKRIYQVSLDQYHNVHKEDAHQIEIEYEGSYRRNLPNNERAIIEDISLIASMILKAFPGLTTSILTKDQWLIA